MLKPVETGASLRELLEEQRRTLEKARVIPSKNYLSKLEPIARAASAEPPKAQASERLPRGISVNSRFLDVLSETTDILEDRGMRGKACDSDEVAAVRRFVSAVRRVLPDVLPLEHVDTQQQAAVEPQAQAIRSPPLSPKSENQNPQPAREFASPAKGEDAPAKGEDAPAKGEDAPAKGEDALAEASVSKLGHSSFQGSFRFVKQLKKLQAVSHTPEVYRNMVASQDAMEKLFKFATHCSGANLGTDQVLHVIESDFAANSKAASSTCFTTDEFGWHRGVSHDYSADGNAPSSEADVPPDLRALTATGSLQRLGDRWVVPLKVESTVVGAVELLGVPADADANLIVNMAHIASMFTRNNTSFLESKWQQRKATAMLHMAEKLAEDTLDEEKLARGIMTATLGLIGADRCSIFLVDESQTKITGIYSELSAVSMRGDRNATNERTGLSIAEHVVKSRLEVNIPDAHADDRYDKSSDLATGIRTGAVLGIPVFFEGRLVAVQQLHRRKDFNATAFTSRDVDLLKTFSTFVGVCLRNCRINVEMLLEKRKSEAILSVVRDMSHSDIRDVQSVVSQILSGARRLLNADRATLFLVDKERNELYSKIADDTDGRTIRLDIGKGIAGIVAKTGQAENITDAYSDPRFNKAIDVSLGYVTKSMLTEAIYFQDEVIAVAQLVNKLEASGTVGFFTDKDQDTFRAFALFAGVSLRNSHLLNFAVDAGREAMELQEVREGRRGRRRAEAALVRNDISEAVVSHVLHVTVDPDISSKKGLRSFNLFDIREHMPDCFDVCTKLVIDIVKDGGYLDEFKCPVETFCRFVLACRDKYRNVPYHNFYHAVDVCQTLYSFIHDGKVSRSISKLDEFVLLLTALVHDLDHMGLNNSFHLKTDSPLGMLSSASGNNSVLEVHHCNLAIEILNDPQKDVFCGMALEQKTFSYRRMIDCVLATDMQRHNDIVNEFVAIDTYDPNNDAHVALACKMLLKAADISNVTKPFDVSRKWGMSVTEEFYQQGDKEREKGVHVLPMFDRRLNNELAKGQIGFIDFIAYPFFKKLSDRFVGLRWTTDNINSNKAAWTNVLQERRNSASS